MPIKDPNKLKEYLNSDKRRKVRKKCYLKHGDTYRAQGRAWIKNNRDKNIKWLLGYLGVEKISCKKCGYDKCFMAIDFHHTNETEKKSNKDIFARWVTRTPKFFQEKIRATEFEFLCKNCHTELHSGLE